MFFKHFLVPFLITTVLSVFGKNDLPPGNFGHFGPCVIKFLRMSDSLRFIDLTEHLIHVNNPSNLIYTVNGRYNFSNHSIQDEKMALDFKFYEVCTITVFVKFGTEDNAFRNLYFSLTRDAHRGLAHSIFIIISEENYNLLLSVPEHRVPFRIFDVVLKINPPGSGSFLGVEMNWFFVCIFCRQRFVSISYTPQIKKITVATFQEHGWRNDVSIGAMLDGKLRPGGVCGKGQYYIAPRREACSIQETQYLTMTATLNVTFVQVPLSEYQTYKWGYYHTSMICSEFYYEINMLHSFRHEGYAIYCNFNIWSENSDLATWVSPFAWEVLLGFTLIMLTVIMIEILKSFFKRANCFVNFESVKNVGQVVFTIWAILVRQTLIISHISVCIFVSFLFTSFVMLVQYELYLTSNLVRPPRYVPLHTLREFFANDYTLVYSSKEIDNLVSLRSQLEEEFVQKSLGDFPHNKTMVIR